MPSLPSAWAHALPESSLGIGRRRHDSGAQVQTTKLASDFSWPALSDVFPSTDRCPATPSSQRRTRAYARNAPPRTTSAGSGRDPHCSQPQRHRTSGRRSLRRRAVVTDSWSHPGRRSTSKETVRPCEAACVTPRPPRLGMFLPASHRVRTAYPHSCATSRHMAVSTGTAASGACQ